MNNTKLQEIIDEVVKIVNYHVKTGNPVDKLTYILPKSATDNILRFMIQHERPHTSATES